MSKKLIVSLSSFVNEQKEIKLPSFLDCVVPLNYTYPPINPYCTEDYECSCQSGEGCDSCESHCMDACEDYCMDSCTSSCESGECGSCESGQGGGGHTCSWSGYVFAYVNNDYHDKYKYCLVGGERHPTQDYRVSHSVSSWGAWYNDSSQGKCKSQGTCSECKSTIAKWQSHSLSTRYAQYSSSQHKKLQSCSSCDYSSTSYESHDTRGQPSYEENGWIKKRCKHCGEGVLISGSHTHNWVAESWRPNGSTGCQRKLVCTNSNCSVKEKTETKSHNWSPYNGTASQCKDCLDCGYTKTHSYWIEDWSYYDATYHKAYYKCSNCNYGAYDVGNGLNLSTHSYSLLHYSQGNETHCEKFSKCSSCKDIKSEFVKHVYVNKVCNQCGREQYPFPDNFEWASPKVAGQPFYFGVDEYRILVDKINQKLTYFEKTKISKTSVTSGEKVFASTINGILGGLRRLNASGVPSDVAPQQQITASFLNKIRDCYNSVKK